MGKFFNAIENTYPETCFRLRSWATWSSRDSNNLGFPRVSVFQSVIEGRIINPKGRGAKRIEDNEVAEDMERALLNLKGKHLEHFTALNLYFQNSSMTLVNMAYSMKLSKERARLLLGEAVAWVDGRLYSIKER